MPLPESILRAWRDTDYRVRLPRGGYASIFCGRPLPAALAPWLAHPDAPWGYLTAWNPGGTRLPRARNRIRQQQLRIALARDAHRWFGGIGVGTGGWREPSLFVPGIDFDALDALAREFGQLGVVRGVGTGLAELNVLL
jgi:hypothetical protein